MIKRAGDRHEDDERAEVVAGRRDQRRVEALEEEQVGEETDQLEQRGGDDRRGEADDDREQRDRDDARRRREIAEMVELRGLRHHRYSVYQRAAVALGHPKKGVELIHEMGTIAPASGRACQDVARRGRAGLLRMPTR